VTFNDLDFLHRLMVQGPAAHMWRLRGRSIAPEDFPKLLWADVLVQHVVLRVDTMVPIGIVRCVRGDERNALAWVEGFLLPEMSGRPWTAEACWLFVDQLFSEWGFRALFREHLEPTIGAVQFDWPCSGEEARLREDMAFDDGWLDRVFTSLRRPLWRTAIRPAASRVRTLVAGGEAVSRPAIGHAGPDEFWDSTVPAGSRAGAGGHDAATGFVASLLAGTVPDIVGPCGGLEGTVRYRLLEAVEWYGGAVLPNDLIEVIDDLAEWAHHARNARSLREQRVVSADGFRWAGNDG
jgi:hypothetical protein